MLQVNIDFLFVLNDLSLILDKPWEIKALLGRAY